MADQTNVLTGAGNVTASTEDTGTTITIAKPTNTANGDVLLAVIYKRIGADPYTTAPAGWTYVAGPIGATTGLVLVYWKRIISAASETATSYNWSGGGSNGRQVGTIMRVTGTHPVSPINASSTTYQTAVTASPQLNLPSIGVTAGGTALALAGLNVSATAVVTTLGYSQVMSAKTATGATDSQLVILKRDYASSVEVGNLPLDVSPAQSSGVGHLITLRSPNQPPNVDSGGDKMGAIGTTTTFTAIISDPDGTIASRQWTQISGPETLTISNGTTNTMKVTPSVGGVFAFKIEATDDVGATAVDYCSLIVPAPDGRAYRVTNNSGAWSTVGSKPTEATAVSDELDQTFIETPDAPNGAAITFRIGTLTTGNITVVTRGRQSATTPQISRKMELLQGSSVIASRTVNLTNVFTDYSLVLTNAQNDAVTDRANLSVRITDTQAV